MKILREAIRGFPDLFSLSAGAAVTGVTVAVFVAHSPAIIGQVAAIWTRTGWTAFILFPMLLSCLVAGASHLWRVLTGKEAYEWNLKVYSFCRHFSVEIGFLGTLWGLAVSLTGVTFTSISAFFHVIEGFSESIFSSIFGVGIYLLARLMQYIHNGGGEDG